MAIGTKRGGGDMVLDGRHLVGLFFFLVVVLGIVFTLGYLLGRNQYDAQLRAAGDTPVDSLTQTLSKSKNAIAGKVESLRKPAVAVPSDKSADDGEQKTAAAPGQTPPATDWDFYHAADPDKPVAALSKPAPKPVAAKPALVPVAGRAAPSKAAAAKSASSNAAARNGVSEKKGALNVPLIPRGATVLQVAALVRQGDALALAQALQKKKFPAYVLSPDGDNFYRVQVGPYPDAASATTAREHLEAQGFKSIIKR